MSNWRNLLKELKQSFQVQEERMNFLHSIDRNILEEDIPLEQICKDVLNEIVEFSKSDLGYLFIDSETELLLLHSTQALDRYKVIPFTDNIFRDKFLKEPYVFQEIDKIEAPIFPVIGEDCSTRILIPLREAKRLWGLIGIESKELAKDSSLNDQEIQDFLKTVCGQLSVAISERKQYEEIQQLYKLQDDLFAKELDITESLQSIISNIIFSLPKIGPLKIEPDPEVQIIFYQEGDEFLTIKATTGPESVNTRVSVKNSISGLLVENSTVPFYLCDPTTIPERYKSYLGKNEQGTPPKQIRTELVVPINFDNKIIGLINLESEKIDAFKAPHIIAMQRLAEKMSPIINALQKRIEKMQLQDKASVYAMRKFLDRFASAFVHKVRTPTSNFSVNLRDIENDLNKIQAGINKESLSRKISRCLNSLTNISSFQEEFAKGLPGFLDFDSLSVNEIIQKAINDFNLGKLEEQNIKIDFNPKEDYKVFCSLFLREHIYNILNNSIYFIREKQKDVSSKDNFIGKILIETSLIIDKEERTLNKQCKIRILDNGKGLDKENLAKIPHPFTTKGEGGTGYGLSAAFQYLKSIGGKLATPKSEPNKFFEVIMYLDIYNEMLHSKMKGQYFLER